ncbi:MAG: 1-acyl-sn-glycerol-3-phosphate acyltransferase [Tannerella sp.]|nr:1-acyl-sn-glycerol-3-phosphate acyltransferase [Tannerella sp.]
MKSSIYRHVLHLLGWKVGPEGDDVVKCVICVAPHTSNTDFLLGKLFYNAIGRKAKFLMKKEWFFFPLSILLKSMGGIPVNRGRSSSTTEQLAEEFARHDCFHLAVTPEGTRKKAAGWKSGFYYIALKAGVPIQTAYIDYGKKEIGINATFYPTGNADEDILTIRSMYENVRGRFTKNFEKL